MPDKHTSSPDFEREIKTLSRTQKPRLYKVIMHNDNYTTMDFVVLVLMKIFRKSEQEAQNLMLQVHRVGYAQCGVFTYDVALTKINEVHQMAKENEFPLRCTCEPE